MGTIPPGVVLDRQPMTAPPPGVVLDSAPTSPPAGVVLDGGAWEGIGLPPLGSGAPRNSRTGQIEHAAPLGTVPVVDAAIQDFGDAVAPGTPWQRRITSGVGGALTLAAPAIPIEGGEAIAAADFPRLIKLLGSLGIGWGTQAGAQAAAQKLGLDAPDAQLIGLGAGLGSGAYSGKALGVFDRLLGRGSSAALAGEGTIPPGVVLDSAPQTIPPAGVVLDSAPEPGGVAASGGQQVATPSDFSAERQALHQQIINRVLDGYTPSQDGKPEAILTAGGTASGKSSAIRAAQVLNPNLVHIAGDEIRPMLPEFEGLKASGQLAAGGAVGQEAGHVANLALQEAQRRGLDIAYESTFAGPQDRRLQQVQGLLDNGYNVTLHARDIPVDEAIKRAQLRAANSENPSDFGRTVDEATIRRTHIEGVRNALAAAKLPINLKLEDNTGAEPSQFAQRVAAGPLQVYDEGRYDAYRAKGSQAVPNDEAAGTVQQAGAGAAGAGGGASAAQSAIPAAAYAQSRERLAQKLAAPTTRLDPAAQYNAGRVGLFHAQAAGGDFDAWSRAMVQDLGDGIKPHLQQVWDQVQRRQAMDKLAGNINLDRLNTADDVKEMIRQTAAANPDAIEQQRRGSIPLATTKQVAEQMVADGLIDKDHFVSLAKGSVLNAEEMVAARGLMLDAAERSLDRSVAAQLDPSPENKVAAVSSMREFMALHQSVAGSTSEAGRALSSFRITQNALRTRSGLERALEQLGDKPITDEALHKLSLIPPEDTTALNGFLRSQAKWSTWDKLQTYFVSNLLSSSRTVARKAQGDLTAALLDPAMATVRGAIDPVTAKLQGRERYYHPQEGLAALRGWAGGIADGFAKGLYVMRNNFTQQGSTDLSGLEMPYELPGGLVNPLNLMGRSLRAVTEVSDTMARAGALRAAAVREVLNQGMTAESAARRVADLMSAPTDGMIDEAVKQGKLLTYLKDPDALLAAIRKVANTPYDVKYLGQIRPYRIILPFTTIPYNLAKMGFQYSPAGFLQLLSADADGPEASAIVAKALIGSGVFAWGAVQAAEGNLTGAAPSDPRGRAQWYASGKQPYSIRIGHHWVSFEKLGPLAISLSMVAAIHDVHAETNHLPDAPSAWTMAAGVGNMMVNQTFLNGMSALLQAVQDPARYGTNWAANVTEGIVPMSAFLRQVENGIDPRIRDTRGFYNAVKAGIPVFANTVPLKYDPMGNAIESGYGGWRTLLPEPVRSTQPPDGPVGGEAARLGVYPSPIESTIIVGNRRIRLSPTQAESYQRMVGQAQLAAAQQAMSSAGYWGQPDDARQEQIKSAMLAARRGAEQQFKATVALGH